MYTEKQFEVSNSKNGGTNRELQKKVFFEKVKKSQRAQKYRIYQKPKKKHTKREDETQTTRGRDQRPSRWQSYQTTAPPSGASFW